MKLLIVSATRPEIDPLLSGLDLAEGENSCKGQEIYVLITGVGMTATAFAMGQTLASRQFDFAINLGIAGSFDRSLPLGSMVQVDCDTFAELGAGSGTGFITIEELGFGKSVFRPIPASFAVPASLLKGDAITVNAIHGDVETIQKTIERLHPQIESMEGAAFFYSCEKVGLPCIQVRAISNYVEKRNKAGWDIPLAIKNLNSFALDFIAHVPRRT